MLKSELTKKKRENNIKIQLKAIKGKSILPKTKSIDPSNAIRSPKLIHRENLLS